LEIIFEESGEIIFLFWLFKGIVLVFQDEAIFNKQAECSQAEVFD